MRYLVALAIFSSACNQQQRHKSPAATAPSPAARPAPSPPAPPSLLAVLAADIGKGIPVAILAKAGEVVAISRDGARRRSILAKKAKWILVDNRASVLWVESDDQLWLLDLTRAAPAPELVIGRLHDLGPVSIHYPARAGLPDEVVASHEAELNTALVVNLDDKRPRLSREVGVYDQIFEEQGKEHKRAFAKTRIVAAMVPRLRELAARGGRLESAVAAAKLPRLTDVDESQCEEPDVCGTAEAIPGTRFWRVIVAHSCGDACHVTWRLYDPDTKHSIPIEYEGEMADIWVAPDGKAFITGGSIYDFTGKAIVSGEGDGGGWLARQWHLGS